VKITSGSKNPIMRKIKLPDRNVHQTSPFYQEKENTLDGAPNSVAAKIMVFIVGFMLTIDGSK